MPKIEWPKISGFNHVFRAGDGCEIWLQGQNKVVAHIPDDATEFAPAITATPALVRALLEISAATPDGHPVLTPRAMMARARDALVAAGVIV